MDSKEGGEIVTHRELSEAPHMGRLSADLVGGGKYNGKSNDGQRFQGVNGLVGEKWSGWGKKRGGDVRMEPGKPSVLSLRWGGEALDISDSNMT